MQNYFKFIENISTNHKTKVKDLLGAGVSLSISEIIKSNPTPYLIVTTNANEALTLEEELKYLLPNNNVLLFPDWETLPYDTFSPYQDIISKRLEILSRIKSIPNSILIISVNTIMGRLAPTTYVNSQAIVLKKGENVNIAKFKEKLIESGYLNAKLVLEHGEFASRGEIIDLFPMGSNVPYRIDFFDDEIESISIFDLDTQRSISKVDEIRLLPAHEFPVDDLAIDRFRRKYREYFKPGDISLHNIYQQISKKVIPAGIEYYLPLFFEKTNTLFNYLLPDTTLITLESIKEKATEFFSDVVTRANYHVANPLHPSLPPKELYLEVDELLHEFKKLKQISLYTNNTEAPTTSLKGKNKELPSLAINNTLPNPNQNIINFVNSFKGKILISTPSEGRKAILIEMLHKDLQISSFNSITEFINSNDKLGIIITPIAKGAIINDSLAFITENEILGYTYISRRKKKNSKTISPDAIIKNLAELKPGEHVVHENHGIAEYRGLEVLKVDDYQSEYVTLMFANDIKMYIPISSLHLLSRYTGVDDVKLTKLGTDAWKKARNKAANKIKDIAASLLEIYANRSVKSGFRYTIDEEEYIKFCSGFGYQTTEDQEKAINAVLHDMKTIKPMDRLICGDVGFGKTEVALRASFVAASNGKQVALLVPTTLLADQHYDNFKERFANTAINVACISRFKSTKEQNQIKSDVENGKIDIIIGTHKLLNKTFKFNNLGLLIVDEEHRFGVTQKERIKELRANIDILTMTATPIPRTLNMAMNGIRDLSIIATPPAKRLSIKTFVYEYDDSIIREAILRELKRGGQTYFLHNDVDSIDKISEELTKLIPEAKIAVAHAQLPEKQLANIMHDFYNKKINLLICSTIIETGIDVPTANTIIMNRADKLGLAQMHQLRGRVGRSHHQAYAYLLTPPPSTLAENTKKRLQAISSLEDLGSGFILATHDMEIRGAGEILGAEQSGQIESIGFSLYMDMLENAVEALKNGEELNLDNMSKKEILIDLSLSALLPSNYVRDINTRLSLYKKLSSCQNKQEISDFKSELIDRFGKLPEESSNLIKIAELKLVATRLGIETINLNNRYGSIQFGNKVHVKFEFLTGLILEHSDIYKLDGPTKIKINIQKEKPIQRLEFIRELLEDMNANYEE